MKVWKTAVLWERNLVASLVALKVFYLVGLKAASSEYGLVVKLDEMRAVSLALTMVE